MGKVNYHENSEVRMFARALSAPGDGDGKTVTGYAALTGVETDMGFYREIIAAGAFDGADIADVRCLFNHDANQVLARTASGTLSLTIDDKGLAFEFTFPDTTAGADVYELVKRGDISQCSFAFTVAKQSWTETEGQPDLRTIEQIETVYDVSLVTFPAYQDTTVALRSKPAATETDNPKTIHSERFASDVAFFNSRLSAV